MPVGLGKWWIMNSNIHRWWEFIFSKTVTNINCFSHPWIRHLIIIDIKFSHLFQQIHPKQIILRHVPDNCPAVSGRQTPPQLTYLRPQAQPHSLASCSLAGIRTSHPLVPHNAIEFRFFFWRLSHIWVAAWVFSIGFREILKMQEIYLSPSQPAI